MDGWVQQKSENQNKLKPYLIWPTYDKIGQQEKKIEKKNQMKRRKALLFQFL